MNTSVAIQVLPKADNDDELIRKLRRKKNKKQENTNEEQV